MRSTMLKAAIATTLLTSLCAGCVPIVIQSAAGNCGRYIPDAWRQPVELGDPPVSAKLADGHDDARPWQSGYVVLLGKVEQMIDRDAAKDHIRDTCEADQAAALKKSRPKVLGIF